METELIQCIFDFETGNQDGLENWRREREAMDRRIRDVWKVPLGRAVRMTLRNVPGSFEGKLTVAQQPNEFNRHIPLQLKLGRMVFAHQEIESCSIIG
jgi:hypothetical protein